MEREKDWTEAMRRALRDAETPPPAGGWQRLQGAMDRSAARRSLVRRTWWRYGAAAAVLLFAWSGGELLWRGYDAPQRFERPDAPAVSESFDPVRSETARRPAGETAGELLRSNGEQPQTVPGSVCAPALRDARRPVRNTLAADDGAAALWAAREPVAATEHAIGDTVREPVTALSGADARPAATGNRSGRADRSGGRILADASGAAAGRGSDFRMAARDGRAGGVSLSLFGGSGASGATRSGHFPQMPVADAFMASNGNGMVMLARSGYSDASFRHHLPLSFGLAVGKEFAHGLSLESGLCYALLRSDVRMRSASEELRQELHFIGVPLRMNWKFLRRGPFALYAGAGGMVERCVSARVGSHAVDEQGVQWSLLAAAGAQYRLGGVAALYFEPEASYYLNDTKLRTSRTDTPLTLSLRLGVRLTF